jgi:LysM repeat protein
MSKEYLRIPLIAVIILLAISMAACTRSASTSPAPEPTEEEAEVSDTQATMEAVRAAILTQTAQAGEPVEETEEAEETTEAEASATPAAVTPEPTAAPADVIEYTVQAGDWIWKIARTYGVDPEEIIDLNDLSSPSQLEVGMVLKIPATGQAAPTATAVSGTPSAGGTVHIVKPGEWIYQIARIYGIDPQAIIDANNLTNPSTIYPGQELTIP